MSLLRNRNDHDDGRLTAALPSSCRPRRPRREAVVTPAELRALAEAATDGPWQVRNDNPRGVYLWSARIETLADFGADPGATPDAMLAALAPDLALLCAEQHEALEDSGCIWARELLGECTSLMAEAGNGCARCNALAKLDELEAR